MTMKKWLTGILTLVMLVSIPIFSSAMSNKELAEKRQQMRENLDNTQEVTYYDLNENQESYKGQLVKFKGKVVGTDNSMAALQDRDGNFFVIAVMTHYQLKLDQEYEISATFMDMRDFGLGGVNRWVAAFSYENSHLPFMTEYSDFYR